MKHTKLISILVFVALANSNYVLSLSHKAQVILAQANQSENKAESTMTDLTSTINFDSIVEEMLFGSQHPSKYADDLLKEVKGVLINQVLLTDNAKKRFAAIRDALEKCVQDKNSVASWLTLTKINFEGILSAKLLQKIKRDFSGLNFMMRLKN